jgi:hypothetical protein
VNAGAVNILYGAASGLVGQGQVLIQGSPGVADTAEPDDSFGSTLAKGFFWNDFNGDGLADLAVGASGEDVGTTVNGGAVNILYGSTHWIPPCHGGTVLHPRQRRHGGQRRVGRRLGDYPRLTRP